MAGTRWVKIDVSYLRNPKIAALTPPAVLLHFASILWTADQLTDGHIPSSSLAELATVARIPRRSIDTRAQELEAGQLWTPNGGSSWELHDFEAMNPQAMRAAVEKQRAKWKQWQEAHRKGERE